MIFFFQAEDGIRDKLETGVQTCALPISCPASTGSRPGRAGNTSGSRTAPNPPHARPPPTKIKIGRASCRERVEISVVAVARKKKERKKKTKVETRPNLTETDSRRET